MYQKVGKPAICPVSAEAIIRVYDQCTVQKGENRMSKTDWLIENGPKLTKKDNVEFGDVVNGQMTIFDYPAACPKEVKAKVAKEKR